MKKYMLLLIVGLLFICQPGYSQTKLIKEVKQKDDSIVIPYKKYRLDNGLTLIIHEDHSDPLVNVNVTYHVGSAREELGKSGFAHFFEHMMFQGSKHVEDEEHFKLISEAGGNLNGTTNKDRNNYFETVPSNQLETALWLEADRMGFLLPAVTQKKFEIQRSTVKNEKQQNYDNRPYGLSSAKTAAAMYPYGHPYSWLTIGKLKDLDQANLEDLKNFFLRYYGPNNATLTIGGDVEPDKVVEMVEKYFGPIPRGPEVKDMDPMPVELDNDRYISHVDDNIRIPALIISYPTVPKFHEDAAALYFLAKILSSGKNSYFHQEFIKKQKANAAYLNSTTDELAGKLTAMILPYPNKELGSIEKDLRQIFKKFEQNGISDQEMQRVKANYEIQLISSLASVSGKVGRLASYETFLGDANYLPKSIQRYRNVTKEDVMRVFKEYVYNQGAVIQSVLPDSSTAPAHADNFTPKTSGENPYPQTDYSGLEYTQPTGDDFDRSKQPEAGKAPLVQAPDFWKSSMENGMKVIGTDYTEIPLVSLQLSIEGGQNLDANHPEKAGLASLTAGMLDESTENYSSEEMSEELNKIGSSISIYITGGNTKIIVRSLKKHLQRTLELVEEKLFRPAFDSTEFDRLKNQQIQRIKSTYSNPNAIANNVYQKLLYGDGHIKSIPGNGLEETVKNISLDDVKNFYQSYYGPDHTELVVVGDVTQEETLQQVDFLTNWESKGISLPELKTPQKPEPTRIYLVDKPGAPQSQIRIGYLTDLPYDATGEYFKATLMNYPLGGAFNSRINLNLREDKGWTYGAGTDFNSGDRPGPFTASAGVKSAATDSAVVEFMEELTNYRKNGITKEELSFMRQSIGQQNALEYETPWQKTKFLGNIIHNDLDKSFVDKQREVIDSIDKETIDDLAQKLIKTDHMNILVVGDADKHRKSLEALGYEVVELSEKGEVISTEK